MTTGAVGCQARRKQMPIEKREKTSRWYLSVLLGIAALGLLLGVGLGASVPVSAAQSSWTGTAGATAHDSFGKISASAPLATPTLPPNNTFTPTPAPTNTFTLTPLCF